MQHDALMKSIKDSLKVGIDMPDTISRDQKNIYVYLVIENLSNADITMINPSHMIIARPNIFHNGEPIMTIKPYFYQGSLKDIITIKGHEVVKVQFSHPLDSLIGPLDFLSKGNYSIHFDLFSIEGIQLKSSIFHFYVK